ncbi:MAG: OmpA family protein [Salinivirgaceae bacterium]|nr:OmpA family protein [Salinivirgaceae bacterium]
MKEKLYIIIVLFFVTVGAFAQKDVSSKADRAYDSGKFFEAIDLYKYAYGKAKDKEVKARITFMAAECYRNVQDNRQAEIWYRKAIRKHYQSPVAILYYGNALRANGKYEEALVEYETYISLVPDDQRGINGKESCTLALEWMENPTRYKVINMYYFNSKQSDYSPAFGKDDYKQVLFTSSREGGTGNNISDVTGEYYSDIFKTRVDRKGKWSEPVPLGEGVNTEFDEGALVTNDKCNTMYFTSFREDKDGNMICKIFISDREGIEWKKAEAQSFLADTITIGHPAISNDELSMVFVADMRGGVGKKDLWKVTRASKTGEWGVAENLGSEINTIGDEVFPYIHADGSLYFSSNGRAGMGGLDIFMADEKSDGTWTVENMKYPINSPADDFAIVFEADKERGYFSSNRSGGRGGDDIYQFSLPPIEFNLLGIVKNSQTEAEIAGANVTLIGSDGTNVSRKTENDGTFTFKLTPNTDYRIIAKRGGFLVSKAKETTKGMTSSKEFRTEIQMSPDDRRIDLPGIMYDFGKWNLRPESLVALETLVEILNDNPNITIEIGSHTDYRGSDQANADLSAKRAESVVKFLITYGIDEERLTSKGYGEAMPKEISKAQVKKYEFLNEGDVLSPSFIDSLSSEEKKETCHQINRRTDFGLTGRDYVPKIKRRK